MAAPSLETPAHHRPRPGPGPVPQSEPLQVLPRTRRWGRRQDPVLAAGSAAGNAAGNAIVTAARVGRILGRSGWRIARQLPGVTTVEHRVHEMARRVNPEEKRAVRLATGAATDPAPLRTAMRELLQRASDERPVQGHDYLFGTIMSQLVPDEARIIAALATAAPFAAVDVVADKDARTVLGNVSTVTTAAGVRLPGRGPTYLDRLDGFGLLEFGPPPARAEADYAALDGQRAVQSALRRGAHVERKSVTLSPLGREFWTACSPARR